MSRMDGGWQVPFLSTILSRRCPLKRVRRRSFVSLACVSAVTWGALIASHSKAWVLPTSQQHQLHSSPSLRRLGAPSKKGPPFRRRPRQANEEKDSQTLSLSATAGLDVSVSDKHSSFLHTHTGLSKLSRYDGGSRDCLHPATCLV